MSSAMYLGIDLGTSEVKALLMDRQQRVIATARSAIAIRRPRPLWSEQDPADWWQATQAAIGALRASHPRELAALHGVGLSGQMHGAVLLDANDQVLRPAILWNDMRASEACTELARRVPQLGEITGNLAMPGFTAPKMLWVAQHEPDLFKRTARVLLPKDYVRLALTGEYVSDMSDASGTLWLDVRRRDWSDTMLAATGLSRAHMPRLVEGAAPSAILKPELARAWGIAGRVTVAGGAGDNAASAIGMGVIASGQGFISLGTSGVLFAACDAYRPDPAQGVHTFCHALAGQWHQMGVMLSAASCLRWAVGLTHAADEAALLREIESADGRSGVHAPLFLPYLSGERTPHNDPHAKGVWFGLQHDTDRALLGYSVLEGVAFGMRDSYLALQAAGSPVRMASLVGGGSTSRYWAQLLADVLHLPLGLHDSANVGAALGAARLGLLAAGDADDADDGDDGDDGDDVGSICVAPPLLDIIEPDPDRHAALMPRFERYRALYSTLKPLFQA